MRETWVRIVAATSGVLAILLALAFAWLQNPQPAPSPATVAAVAQVVTDDPSLVEAGRAVYLAQGCALCHAIAGTGNPRYPLDGVGDRLSPQDLRNWTLGLGDAQGALPARAVRIKEDYRVLPADELDALVGYLASLRQAGTRVTP
jgi:cbb3-type cytochrome oxidase cytochrome c subunit